jgi:hypothetical protein
MGLDAEVSELKSTLDTLITFAPIQLQSGQTSPVAFSHFRSGRKDSMEAVIGRVGQLEAEIRL